MFTPNNLCVPDSHAFFFSEKFPILDAYTVVDIVNDSSVAVAIHLMIHVSV